MALVVLCKPGKCLLHALSSRYLKLSMEGAMITSEKRCFPRFITLLKKTFCLYKEKKGSNNLALKDTTIDCSNLGDHISNAHLKWSIRLIAHNSTYFERRHVKTASLTQKIRCLLISKNFLEHIAGDRGETYLVIFTGLHRRTLLVK